MKVFSKNYLSRMRFSFLVTLPFIIMMMVPALIMDLSATLYQYINFTAYKIPKVKRSEYIVFDRHHLSHLNWLEKFYCLYCAYFNGVLGYVSEIGARTELFWCPIQHQKRPKSCHRFYQKFLPYAPDDNYYAKRKALRLALSKKDETV